MSDISGLTDMGFTPQQAEEALKMTNNDMQKAIAFLVDGVVEDSVQITNREDIPDVSSLSTRSMDAPPYQSTEHYEYGTSQHQEIVRDVDFDSLSDSADSTDLPEPQAREDGEPAVLITPSLNKTSGLAAVFIVVLSQLDVFRSKVNRSTDNVFLSDLRDIVNEFNSGTKNYVINNLNIPLSDADGAMDYVQAICKVFNENFVNVFEDNFMEKLVYSTVGDATDEQATPQEFCVIEVETEQMSGTVHGNMSNLFWGCQREGLGEVWYQDVGSMLTLFFSSDLGYWPKPLQLAEIIYPELYGEEFTKKFKQMHQQYMEVVDFKNNMAGESLKLSVFQGKKISSFLQQATDFTQDEEAKKELSAVTDKVQQQKIDLHNKIEGLNEEARKLDINNSYQFTEGLTPYMLVCIAFSESEYFYYNKSSESWVYVNVQPDLNFTQDFTNFQTIQGLLQDRLRHRAIDFLLIYCSRDKFFETVSQEEVPTSGSSQSSMDSMSEESGGKSGSDTNENPHTKGDTKDSDIKPEKYSESSDTKQTIADPNIPIEDKKLLDI